MPLQFEIQSDRVANLGSSLVRGHDVHLPEFCEAIGVASKPMPSKDISLAVRHSAWDPVETQVVANVCPIGAVSMALLPCDRIGVWLPGRWQPSGCQRACRRVFEQRLAVKNGQPKAIGGLNTRLPPAPFHSKATGVRIAKGATDSKQTQGFRTSDTRSMGSRLPSRQNAKPIDPINRLT